MKDNQREEFLGKLEALMREFEVVFSYDSYTEEMELIDVSGEPDKRSIKEQIKELWNNGVN